MKILKTNTAIYLVKHNEDGTLFVSTDGKNSICHAGSFILNMGGIDGVLARCTDVEGDDFSAYIKALRREKEERKAVRQARKAEENATIVAELKEKVKDSIVDGTMELTYDNLRDFLRLHAFEGCQGFALPNMGVAYSCNVYDCDGKTACAIKFDNPVTIGNETSDKWVYGAPTGHLVQYNRI